MIYLANDNSNCIQHHGVLGMKLGHHRYKVNMRKAKNARQAAKEWDEIAAAERERGKKRPSGYYTSYKKKHLAAANKYTDNAKKWKKTNIIYSGGKKVYDYTLHQKTGKTVAKALLMGDYGALKYNQSRVKGDSRLKSLGRALVYQFADNISLGSVSSADDRKNKKAYENKQVS